jgi:hypothetical protein
MIALGIVGALLVIAIVTGLIAKAAHIITWIKRIEVCSPNVRENFIHRLD